MATFTYKRNGAPEQNFTGTVWVNMNVLLLRSKLYIQERFISFSWEFLYCPTNIRHNSYPFQRCSHLNGF